MNQQVKMEKEMFLNEFPTLTFEEWKRLVDKSLKGASFKEKLVTKTYEGIDIQPLYRMEDIIQLPHIFSLPGLFPFVRGTRASGYLEQPWEVAQELVYGHPRQINEAALNDLSRGQTTLNILLDHASSLGLDPDQGKSEEVGNGGVSIFSEADISTLLEGIDLEKTPLVVQTEAMGLPIFSMLMAYLQKEGKDIQKLRGCIGMDPLGMLVKEGNLPFSIEQSYEMMAQIACWAKEYAPELQTIQIQGHVYHDGGGSSVEELAFTLATGVEYLVELKERGLSIEDIAPRMRFSLSVGSDFFLEIAKFRAARLLWANIIQAFGCSAESQKMYIHARTSARTKTVYDPYVNILRSTTEAFSAILGGADSLHVSTFDEAIQPADEFSRRIARNISLILEKEAHLSQVVDPAGGSWYVESLTNSIAEKAWKLLQEVECFGGMLKALQHEFPQSKIAKIASKRLSNIGRRKDKMVGTNKYPNLKENTAWTSKTMDQEVFHKNRCKEAEAYRKSFDAGMVESALQAFHATLIQRSEHLVEAAVEAARKGATMGDLVKTIRLSDPVMPLIRAIRPCRGGALFEQLRKKADIYKQKTGCLPTVFLANLGPIDKYKARVDYTIEFFESGGFEVIQSEPFNTVEKTVEEFLSTNVSIIVICSSDDNYPQGILPIAKQIKKEASETTIIVVGLPDTAQAAICQEAGVDAFIDMHTNCYETLSNLQLQKGIG